MTNVIPLPPGRAASSDAGPDGLDAATVIADLRAALAGVDLDCECRLSLERALDRFAVLEMVRLREAALIQARGRRRQILLILDLLAEIDEIAATEPDQTVFDEFARLFRDIAAAAADGAEAMSRAVSGGLSPAPSAPQI